MLQVIKAEEVRDGELRLYVMSAADGADVIASERIVVECMHTGAFLGYPLAIVDRPAPTPTPAPGLDLDAVERAERAMTPGPWRHGSVERHHVFCSEGDRSLLCPEAGRVLLRMNEHFPHDSDAAGIVALRNSAPALIAEVRALRRHYDAAGPDHNLLALLDLYHEREQAALAKLAETKSLLRSAGDLFVEIQATDGEDEHKAITDGAKLSAAIAAALEAL